MGRGGKVCRPLIEGRQSRPGYEPAPLRGGRGSRSFSNQEVVSVAFLRTQIDGMELGPDDCGMGSVLWFQKTEVKEDGCGPGIDLIRQVDGVEEPQRARTWSTSCSTFWRGRLRRWAMVSVIRSRCLEINDCAGRNVKAEERLGGGEPPGLKLAKAVAGGSVEPALKSTRPRRTKWPNKAMTRLVDGEGRSPGGFIDLTATPPTSRLTIRHGGCPRRGGKTWSVP